MDYMQVSEGRVVVLPERRNWTDFQTEAHVNYHRAVLSLAGSSVLVTVNARLVPCAALLHVNTFCEIARVVRNEFKNTIDRIVITDASYTTMVLYRLMCTMGAIGTSTSAKISFNTTADQAIT